MPKPMSVSGNAHHDPFLTAHVVHSPRDNDEEMLTTPQKIGLLINFIIKSSSAILTFQ